MGVRNIMCFLFDVIKKFTQEFYKQKDPVLVLEKLSYKPIV
ncbi:hypothetical protein FEM08_03720 [Flavobacterium gilvum]|nr:hypothetical protein FEM08_03720 [Flavobacterium gilvum]